MILLIEIKDSLVELKLKEGEKTVDSLGWRDDRSLSEKLLPKIDELLKRNNLQVKDLEEARHKINLDETYSTYRITEATVKTLNYCHVARERRDVL
ncbi:MAG: hypothetical protein GF347_02235 [Candidatus Moranbacteria bacterium]|nr:hypothetical protein [Candidatus Moranbacteria bacterium]